MSFTVPQSFELPIPLSVINSSSQGQTMNMVAAGLNYARDNKTLPGIATDGDVPTCTGNTCTSNLYYNQNTLLATSNVLVCGYEYTLDNDSAIKVAIQEATGLKPTQAFTATLTKRPS